MIKPNVRTRTALIEGKPVEVMLAGSTEEPSEKPSRKIRDARILKLTKEQEAEAGARGWKVEYLNPGFRDASEDYSIYGVLKRVIPVQEAVVETEPPPKAKSTMNADQGSSFPTEKTKEYGSISEETRHSGTVLSGNNRFPTDLCQYANTVSADRQLKTAVVPTSEVGGPPPFTAPAPFKDEPRPVLVKGDATTALARLENGFGIAALDAMRGDVFTGPHVEIGVDSEWVEGPNGRGMLTYQLVTLERSLEGVFELHEWVVFSTRGVRPSWADAVALVIKNRSREYAYADFQGWWVHLPRGKNDEVALSFVHAPASKARMKALRELCASLPYAEEAESLLAWTPFRGDIAPAWARKLVKALGGEDVETMRTNLRYLEADDGFAVGDDGVVYVRRGLLRADSLYDDGLTEMTDEQRRAIAEGRRYRDVFEGTRATGCSVGYTNDYSGLGFGPDGEKYPDWKINVTIIAHYGMADLSAFGAPEFQKDLMVRLSKVQGGVVTIQTTGALVGVIDDGGSFQKVLLDVRDTMAYAPAGKKKLADLGRAIEFPKVELPEGMIEHMDELWANNLPLYLEYAVNDAVVCLIYAKALFGTENNLPITANSAAARVAKTSIKKYFGCTDDDTFNARYRGLVRVKNGMSYGPEGLVPFESLCPMSIDVASVLNMSSIAYHGGLNASSLIGFYDDVTYDVDAQNAYPTGMNLVVDVNWDDPILQSIHGRDLTLDDFDHALGPCTPLLAEVEFEFPQDVYQPCIPIVADGSLIFPRSDKGAWCVVATAPELWLALKLGARVQVKSGARLRPLRHGDGLSQSLSAVVRTFVESRNEAKKIYGKGSLAELLAKLGVNGNYGKVAQGVSPKASYNAFREVMEELEGSIITSPYHAAFITGLIRALLAAAINQLRGEGYRVFSVTTDGFITDAPIGVLEALDLYGLAPYFHRSRSVLTSGTDDSIWALKHAQDDLLNFTTRGNVSLRVGGDDSVLDGLPGVCAHNSFVTGLEKDSFDDRFALMHAVATRTGRIETSKARPTEFRSLVSRNDRQDFAFRNQTRYLSMDFDCKRKPLRDGMIDVGLPIGGCVANFDTEPWDDVRAYQSGKALARRIADEACLRTRADWERYFLRQTSLGKFDATDPSWALVKAALNLYRMGQLEIPALERLNDGSKGSIQRCCDWANRFVPRCSKHYGKLTRDVWKKLGKTNRNVVAPEMLADVIDAMQADDPRPWLALWGG